MCITLSYGKRHHLHPFPVLKDSKGRLYGWKVFRVLDDGSYVGEYCGTATSRPEDKWLKADDYSPPSHEMESAASIYAYEAGWHVFTRKKEADRYSRASVYKIIVKVFVRKVREKGYITVLHDQLRCFVADEIFIPK